MPEDKIIPPVLGCKKDPIDERDFVYEDIMGAMPPDMPSFAQGYDTEEKYGALRDEWQGHTYGCVTFGGTNDIEMSVLVATGQKIQLSERDAYSQIYIKPNGASSPRDFYKLANQKGVCGDDFLPTNAGQDLTEEWLRNRQGESPQLITDALKWKIGPYYSITSLNIDVIAQAVFSNWGCGGAYWPYNNAMGHFIFFKGYGMFNGFKAIKYRDSYPPYQKWIYFKDGNYYLQDGTQINLGSVWTFQKGQWETDKAIESIKKVFGPDWQPAPIFVKRNLIVRGIYGAVRVVGADSIPPYRVFTLGPGGGPINSPEEFKALFDTLYQSGIVGTINSIQAQLLGIDIGSATPITLKSNIFVSLWRYLVGSLKH
jgi:hypothetical protein